jgi:hypothetical protein
MPKLAPEEPAIRIGGVITPANMASALKQIIRIDESIQHEGICITYC